MKGARGFAITVTALLALAPAVLCQSHYEYKFVFNGFAYQTNAVGKLASTPISDQTFLRDIARRGGVADVSTISLVYHLNGNPLGDTIDVISNATGQTLSGFLGLYYGSAGNLGRTAVTNAAQSSQRRIDYIYTSNKSTYSFDNDDSVGASMTIKNLVVNNNMTNWVISGNMSWGVQPQETNGPILCIGKFSLGPPMF
ncbi:MAG TPA: hypothetical protein VGO67_06550 [Verrucomicrobiae bacterium]